MTTDEQTDNQTDRQDKKKTTIASDLSMWRFKNVLYMLYN